MTLNGELFIEDHLKCGICHEILIKVSTTGFACTMQFHYSFIRYLFAEVPNLKLKHQLKEPIIRWQKNNTTLAENKT